jgi:hypothetical protein
MSGEIEKARCSSRSSRVNEQIGHARFVRRRDRAPRGDTLREMEAADWASLSDQDLLERRISKLGLRLEGTTLAPLIGQLYDEPTRCRH